MNHEFMDALEQVEKEKGISKDILLDAIETALASAYKRDQKAAQSIEVRIDPDNGEFHVYTHKTVVEAVEDEKNEIALEDAQKINPIYELGDLVEFEIFPKEFGRIAAQTAKQVVVQRIREAERSIIYEEFANRVGDLITGIVQRFEQRNIFVDLGRLEGILPANEQMPNERYEQGTRLKTYIVEVKKTTKGPQVLLSRARTGLLKRLLELEVPEIQDGLVEIRAIAREPGNRSKVAVYSRDPQIDPVGSCVGARGIRIQMIVRELKGEKIDVIPWSADPIEFIISALSPAKVSEVKILPSKKTAIVIVPDFQLSLAIGKEGQNARLAAKLTGWKIDIKSQSQAEECRDKIDELVRNEIGFKTVEPVEEIVPGASEEPEQPEEAAEEAALEGEALIPEPESEEFEEAPAASESEAEQPTVETSETEPEPEKAFEPEPHLEIDDEDEEGIALKKKIKKSKPSPKHLARIEYDDEPLSDDDNYFFADVLKKREASQGESETIPETYRATLKEANESNSGFTIGQLLAEELAKKTKQQRKKSKS
ncbi:MAG TPA: transcription termination factor NusA [Bacillota bacterium]